MVVYVHKYIVHVFMYVCTFINKCLLFDIILSVFLIFCS